MAKIVIKEKLYRMIAGKCLSVSDLLKTAGCSLGVWRSISHGKPVRLGNIGKIAKALGVSVEELWEE